MKLIVGLGNPGTKYAYNRHNIGFIALDHIAQRHNFGAWRKRFQGDTAEGRLNGQKCLLLKPATYMNESGRSVREAVNFYKIDLEDLIAIHDELDIKPGKLKVKVGGGHAGHNGLRSISSHVGNDYMRVRMGIGHPGQKNLVHTYVLHDFHKADESWLAPLLDAVADCAPFLADGDGAHFMNKVALALQVVGSSQKQKISENAEAHQTDRDKMKSSSRGPDTKTKGPFADVLGRWRDQDTQEG
ncbi:MAG: aminoacyl-tRNA hydrolase [Pseudomonadota bacterium]